LSVLLVARNAVRHFGVARQRGGQQHHAVRGILLQPLQGQLLGPARLARLLTTENQLAGENDLRSSGNVMRHGEVIFC
jgi:hypothetical protein